MPAIEQILSELEAATAGLSQTGEHSLETLGELCARRGEMIGELFGAHVLDRAALERVKSILQMGTEASLAIEQLRKSLQQELRDMNRSVHVARQWGANLAQPRGGMAIDA